MLKNALFLEKAGKIASALGIRPQTPVSLRRLAPPPATGGQRGFRGEDPDVAMVFPAFSKKIKHF